MGVKKAKKFSLFVLVSSTNYVLMEERLWFVQVFYSVQDLK